MAGYSPKSLAQKLGFKAGDKVLFIANPTGYEEVLGPLPPGILIRSVSFQNLNGKAIAKAGPFSFIQIFSTETSELRAVFPILKNLLAKKGMLWVSWPKRIKGKLPTDVSDPLEEKWVRELGLASGLVDVKIAAVDEKWSGLKFVYRQNRE